HTRFSRDWSSDVCSSDLGAGLKCPFIDVEGRRMYTRGNAFALVPDTKPVETGGGSLRIKREILGSHPDIQIQYVLLSKVFLGVFPCRSGQFFVIDQKGIPFAYFKRTAAAHSFGDAFGHLFHF